MNNNNNSSIDHQIISCPNCGKFVTQANLALHQYSGRCRPAAAGSTESDAISIVDDSFEQQQQQEDVVCLLDEEMEDGNSNGDDGQAEEWACPRCTLLNPIGDERCNACELRRPISVDDSMSSSPSDVNRNDVRAADPAVRDRLIDDYDDTNNNGSLFSSPMFQRSVGGGALLGGMIGGTSALLRGDSISSGTLSGIITGSVTGAITAELAREVAGITSEGIRMGAGDPSAATASSAAAQHQNVSSGRQVHARRLVVRRLQNGQVQTIYGNTNMNSPMTEMMLRGIFSPNAMGVRGGDIDNMSYEQILDMFGNGMENRGADERTIHNLPSSTVTNVSDLPEDQRCCSICLEDFQNNDKVRRLPCLHFFHEDCVDRWLRSSASCPVCKHSVRSD